MRGRLQFSVAQLTGVVTAWAVLLSLWSYFEDIAAAVFCAAVLAYGLLAWRAVVARPAPQPMPGNAIAVPPAGRHRPSWSVRLFSVVALLVGTWLFGLHALVLFRFEPVVLRDGLFLLHWSLAAGVLAASLALLCALFMGASLGRWCGLPFCMALGWSIQFGVEFVLKRDSPAAFDWLVNIAALAAGTVCVRALPRFGDHARRAASYAAAAAFALGLILLTGSIVYRYFARGGTTAREHVYLVVCAAWVALLAGILGALVGGVLERSRLRRGQQLDAASLFRRFRAWTIAPEKRNHALAASLCCLLLSALAVAYRDRLSRVAQGLNDGIADYLDRHLPNWIGRPPKYWPAERDMFAWSCRVYDRYRDWLLVDAARRQTSGLPPVNRAEILTLSESSCSEEGSPPNGSAFASFHIRPYGDNASAYVRVLAQATLDGQQAEGLAELWRTREFSRVVGMPPHAPIYALRFYAHGRLVLETSLCWDFGSGFGRVSSLQDVWYDFTDADSALLMRLLEILPPPCETQAAVLTRLGTRLFREGRVESALSMLARAVRVDPGFSAAYYCRGSILEILAQREGAIREFSLAISCAHRDGHHDSRDSIPLAHIARGNLRLACADSEGAISDFTRAIELRGDEAEPHEFDCRGMAYLRLGNTMKALADFNRAIELGAENGEVQYHRGRAYQALGQETRASDDFRAALTALDSEIGSGSGDSEMYLLRGRVFQSIGNHSKATSDFQTALREADAGVTQALAGRKNGIYYFRAFQSRAEVYDTLGDHGKAEEDRRWLRSFDPEERSKKPATLPPKPN